LRDGVVSASLGQVLTGILSKPDDELLRQERAVLARLQIALARFDTAPEQQLTLGRSIAQLDELFLLVHLAQRRRQYQDRIVGDADSGRFHDDRARLIDSVGRESQRVIDSYDRQKEARELADGARNAVAAAAAVSVLGLTWSPEMAELPM
jgi:hypothetical protein